MRSRFHPRLFTPKHPSTLPKSQWLSYTRRTRLFSIVQPYAPARVWRQGRGNLKQLVIEWCQHIGRRSAAADVNANSCTGRTPEPIQLFAREPSVSFRSCRCPGILLCRPFGVTTFFSSTRSVFHGGPPEWGLLARYGSLFIRGEDTVRLIDSSRLGRHGRD